jgi:protein-S-isoprenylcysteine O-methyltransferase Ste14
MNTKIFSKILYGVLFCVMLPGLLVLWVQHVSVNIPMGEWQTSGWIVFGAGIMVILWGMTDLWLYGKGLPMNAFPPEQYVSRGAYAVFRHPIYVGFCMTCAGLSCVAMSSSGLYVVTPIMAASCWALVQGYERSDLEKRFGNMRHKPLFGLPENSGAPASFAERLFPAAGVFATWILIYEGLIFFGVNENFVDTMTAFEKQLPVVPLAEIPYFATYFFVAAVPVIVKNKSQLRLFIMDAWVIVAGGLFLQFILPFYSSQRPVEYAGFLSDLMLWERAMDGPAAAFPSFHVMWAFVAASGWNRSYPSLKWIWIIIALIIAWSCSATGVHSIADIVSGAAVFAMVHYRRSIWRYFQRISQRLANSWTSWTFENFRIINHSVYAGLAGLAGIGIASLFIADHRVLIVITGMTLLGGAAWGQWLEGSSRLLRPFGYYGAIIGGITGVLICAIAFGFSWHKSVGALAMASPWTQAIGRLRCLVQGCCHGRISETGNGIIYSNEHSRVCKISELKGRVIHNTQLYSMVSNAIIGLLLWRFWYGGASPTMLAGLYLILNGVARFVEESYRGEVQTKIIGKLPVYQWTAIGSMVLGALITTLNSVEALAVGAWNSASILAMLFAGFASAFAMGMDFPKSTIPFSRLSG